MSGADQYKRRVFSEEVADDQEVPPGRDKDRPDRKVVPLYRSNLPVVLTAADRFISPFPFGSPDETSRIAFDLLDQDLRTLKGRYLTALEKKADAADRPELAQDIRVIAEAGQRIL